MSLYDSQSQRQVTQSRLTLTAHTHPESSWPTLGSHRATALNSPCPRPHLDVFVQVHRLVVDVVLQEVLIHTGQQGHLGQREDIHELLHGVSVRALQREGRLSNTDPISQGDRQQTADRKPRVSRDPHLAPSAQRDLTARK